MAKGRKTKSKKQVRFLFSSASPLSSSQKRTLQGELRRGDVKIRKGSKRK